METENSRKKSRPRFTQDERDELMRLAKNGVKQKELAERFGTSQAVVSLIVNGKTYQPKAEKISLPVLQDDVKVAEPVTTETQDAVNPPSDVVDAA